MSRAFLPLAPVSVIALILAIISLLSATTNASVASAPRTLYYKSNSSSETKNLKSSTIESAAIKRKQESVISWLERTNAATSSSIMEQFNEFGPFLSSYVVVRNIPGLPGNNYISYPADRTSGSQPQQQRDLPIASEGRFPVAVYSFGYGASCTSKPAVGGSLHMDFMAYLASWGIVTGCPTDRANDNWDGGVLIQLMDGMTALNENEGSMFYNKLKTDRFATIGRSYGGNRAINAAAKRQDRVAAVISDAQCTAAWCTPTRENDVSAPSLYVIGSRDEYLSGVQLGYSRLSVPKQLLIARGRTHDSAPMQVWRSWVTLFILLHVNGDSEFGSTVWGEAFYSTPLSDRQWGLMSIGTYRTSKYLNYWPACATESISEDLPRYDSCPPSLCATTSVATVSASSSRDVDDLPADMQNLVGSRYVSVSRRPPSHIDIDESSISLALERDSMRQGLVEFLTREGTLVALIQEVGEYFDLNDSDNFDGTACHVLQTLTNLGDMCAFEDDGTVSFQPEFEALLFEIVQLVDEDEDGTVTPIEVTSTLRRYRTARSAYKNANSAIDNDIMTATSSVCPTYDSNSPTSSIFS